MFKLGLRKPHALALREALETFLSMGFCSGKIYVSADELTVIAPRFRPVHPNHPMIVIPYVVLALRFRTFMFEEFRCDRSLGFKLDISQLVHLLSEATEDNFLVIKGTYSRNTICMSVSLIDLERGEYNDRDVTFSVQPGKMAIPEFHYEYQVIVGIPSNTFGRLLVELDRIMNLLKVDPEAREVSARVTDTQVTISAVNEEVVYKKELNECIIGGSVGEDPVSMVFVLHNIVALVHATSMSHTVWLLGQSNGSSAMLNCPVYALGNLMFYFDRR